MCQACPVPCGVRGAPWCPRPWGALGFLVSAASEHFKEENNFLGLKMTHSVGCARATMSCRARWGARQGQSWGCRVTPWGGFCRQGAGAGGAGRVLVGCGDGGVPAACRGGWTVNHGRVAVNFVPGYRRCIPQRGWARGIPKIGVQRGHSTQWGGTRSPGPARPPTTSTYWDQSDLLHWARCGGSPPRGGGWRGVVPDLSRGGGWGSGPEGVRAARPGGPDPGGFGLGGGGGVSAAWSREGGIGAVGSHGIGSRGGRCSSVPGGSGPGG